VRKILKYSFIILICFSGLAFIVKDGKTLYVIKHAFNLFTTDNLSNTYLNTATNATVTLPPLMPPTL
jgi:hypothetical protein